jgi:threonylcarbamoyladenosine tRNA methylthiotransferase MtaB
MRELGRKRVSFHTLGCKLNYAETASISQQFLDRGFEVVEFGQPSDVFVLNSCSVTENAERECRQLIRRALRVSPSGCTIVLGCYAQLRPDEIARIPGVDYVIGAKEKFELFRYVQKFQKQEKTSVYRSLIHEASDFGPAFSSGAANRTRAFLKVQDGCDYHCSFCTIPLARGQSRSQSIDETVAQAAALVDRGYREIVLTGVNVGDFGRMNDENLLGLLRRLEEVDGLERIRISSIEPNLLTPEIIRHVHDSEKMCRHFHIPLQSGSDEILKLMRRRYLTRSYRELVDSIKEILPDAGIGVDVIVGFPGETDQHFEESYRFLAELPVSYLHVFTYSERPNTAATKLPGKVEQSTRVRRSEMLRNLSLKKRHHFFETLVGKVQEVLMESATEDGYRIGHASNYAKVGVPVGAATENEIVQVTIEGLGPDFCIGKRLNEPRGSGGIEFDEAIQVREVA